MSTVYVIEPTYLTEPARGWYSCAKLTIGPFKTPHDVEVACRSLIKAIALIDPQKNSSAGDHQ